MVRGERWEYVHCLQTQSSYSSFQFLVSHICTQDCEIAVETLQVSRVKPAHVANPVHSIMLHVMGIRTLYHAGGDGHDCV